MQRTHKLVLTALMMFLPGTAAFASEGAVDWIKSWEKGRAEAKRRGKVILVFLCNPSPM